MGSSDEIRALTRGRLAWDRAHMRGYLPGKQELIKHGTAMLRVWARCKRLRIEAERPTISNPDRATTTGALRHPARYCVLAPAALTGGRTGHKGMAD